MVYQSHWLLSAASFAAGVWLITRPHPPFTTSPPALRWILRALSCVAVARSLGTFTAVETGNMTGRTLAAIGFAYHLVRWLAVPFPYLFFLHLRPLAQRLPNPSLARHCAIIGPATSAALLVFVGVGHVARLWLWTDYVRFQAWRLPVLVPLITAGVALVVLSLWATITLLRFCFGVLKARTAARAAAGP